MQGTRELACFGLFLALRKSKKPLFQDKAPGVEAMSRIGRCWWEEGGRRKVTWGFQGFCLSYSSTLLLFSDHYSTVALKAYFLASGAVCPVVHHVHLSCHSAPLYQLLIPTHTRIFLFSSFLQKLLLLPKLVDSPGFVKKAVPASGQWNGMEKYE